MLDKFASYNRFSNRSMELVSCLSSLHRQIQELAKEASQDNVDKIAALASEFETLSEAYKASLLNALQELTDQGSDVIEGISDEKGVRL
tara:strand:- start:514 stop:780 length:267 start_codon:yes stop_codon:yes gene_type:complete